MTTSHILGFPRIGKNRELKKALEAYWKGEITHTELLKTGEAIQQYNWKIQADAGLDFITVGDFSWYDHVLDTSALFGVVPARFKQPGKSVDLNTLFCMARGQAPCMQETPACEMTKWFNTNYHYIVPEFTKNQHFELAANNLCASIEQAQSLGYRVKPILLGPLTYLWLGKTKGNVFDKLRLLKKLVPVYNQLLAKLSAQNIEWIQIDEPIFALDLPDSWKAAYAKCYSQLDFQQVRCLFTTYFSSLDEHLAQIKKLPVHGIHLDFSENIDALDNIVADWPTDKILSAGVINGRNIWKADLHALFPLLQKSKEILGDRLWIASSCALQHVPVDLESETHLDLTLKSWLAFAKQKVEEISLLAQITQNGTEAFSQALTKNKQDILSRNNSTRIHNPAVQERITNLTQQDGKRESSYAKRAAIQQDAFNLPILPTTTIGSFPQTQEIRSIRQQYKAGKIDTTEYTQHMQNHIREAIQKQEALDIDVLVHGEAERNDMVEYFGERMEGFAFTSQGWVQSYGSRCVKPPIIYGDVSRPTPMTITWTQYAQSLTTRPVKGMLTGPVTILAWSFVRDDQPHAITALQIALALRDEVMDLEKAGIRIIQIDEPAFREALPLKEKDWKDYLKWAVFSFRVAASGVQDHTQIHTHMCYSEFNHIIQAIADLDADVISIESSRSEMELLKAFESFAYPNAIGPGVFDIHSPRIPTTEEMAYQLEKAEICIPVQQLWVNPDCGLKTRTWPEVELSLANMVSAARKIRAKHSFIGLFK